MALTIVTLRGPYIQVKCQKHSPEKRGRTARRKALASFHGLSFKGRPSCFRAFHKQKHLRDLHCNCSGRGWGEEDIFSVQDFLFCQWWREGTSEK